MRFVNYCIPFYSQFVQCPNFFGIGFVYTVYIYIYIYIFIFIFWEVVDMDLFTNYFFLNSSLV